MGAALPFADRRLAAGQRYASPDVRDTRAQPPRRPRPPPPRAKSLATPSAASPSAPCRKRPAPRATRPASPWWWPSWRRRTRRNCRGIACPAKTISPCFRCTPTIISPPAACRPLSNIRQPAVLKSPAPTPTNDRPRAELRSQLSGRRRPARGPEPWRRFLRAAPAASPPPALAKKAGDTVSGVTVMPMPTKGPARRRIRTASPWSWPS